MEDVNQQDILFASDTPNIFEVSDTWMANHYSGRRTAHSSYSEVMDTHPEALGTGS